MNNNWKSLVACTPPNAKVGDIYVVRVSLVDGWFPKEEHGIKENNVEIELLSEFFQAGRRRVFNVRIDNTIDCIMLDSGHHESAVISNVAHNTGEIG